MRHKVFSSLVEKEITEGTFIRLFELRVVMLTMAIFVVGMPVKELHKGNGENKGHHQDDSRCLQFRPYVISLFSHNCHKVAKLNRTYKKNLLFLLCLYKIPPM